MAAAIEYASSDEDEHHVFPSDAGEPLVSRPASEPKQGGMLRGSLVAVNAAPEPAFAAAAASSAHVDGPIAGPRLPGAAGGISLADYGPDVTAVGSGALAEDVEVDDAYFRQQFGNLHSLGFAADPAGSAGVVGNAAAASHMRGFDVRNTSLTNAQKRSLMTARHAAELSGAARLGWGRSRQTAVEAGTLTEAQRRHRVELGLPEDELEEGEGGRAVEAGERDGEDDAGGASAAASSSASSTAPGAARRRRRQGDGDPTKAGLAPEATTSEFLGKAEVDFQGKSWVEPDAEARAATAAEPQDRPASVPRKCVHRFTGHSKGVQDVEFFPNTGHLLLTASLDNTVRIWQSGGTRKCQRVYAGHTAGVRQARFRSDGLSFATCSFDTHVKLWDTETGKCTASFQTAARGTPYCVSFHPHDEETFIVGASDRRATQFDARSGEITQTYDYHLDAVNTVTFFDDGRKLVTTSDDKKILVWEFGINVPVRWIADPSMHSIAAATLHPSGAMWCAQSLDNQVLVYNLLPKLSLNRKQRFTGHINGGYACKLSLSANGQFIASGDAQGRLWVWDWKSRKPYAKLPAHEGGPCIGCAWNPGQGSYVATCGWDGVAKLWGPASGK